MITVFYHPDSKTIQPPSTTLVLLGFASGDVIACDNANSGFTSNYYIDDSDFIDATILTTDPGLSNLAGAGYYSDGKISRYWSGTAFGLSGLCGVFNP